MLYIYMLTIAYKDAPFPSRGSPVSVGEMLFFADVASLRSPWGWTMLNWRIRAPRQYEALPASDMLMAVFLRQEGEIKKDDRLPQRKRTCICWVLRCIRSIHHAKQRLFCDGASCPRLPADSAAQQRHVQARGSRGTSIVFGNDEHGIIQKKREHGDHGEKSFSRGLPDAARRRTTTTTSAGNRPRMRITIISQETRNNCKLKSKLHKRKYEEQSDQKNKTNKKIRKTRHRNPTVISKGARSTKHNHSHNDTNYNHDSQSTDNNDNRCSAHRSCTTCHGGQSRRQFHGLHIFPVTRRPWWSFGVLFWDVLCNVEYVIYR